MDSVASKPTVLDEIAAHERSEFTRSFDELKKEAAKKEKARMEEENRLMWPHLYKVPQPSIIYLTTPLSLLLIKIVVIEI